MPFHSQAINAFYEVLNIKDDGYEQNLVEHQDWDEIISVRYEDGVQWKISKDESISFKCNVMKRDAKVWLYFVASKMLLCLHVSAIIRERTVLIYAIVTEKFISIG